MKDWLSRVMVAAALSFCLSGAQAQSVSKVGSVDSLLSGLEARVASQPDDADGWALLARSYHFLGRQEEAVNAIAKAQALGYAGELPSMDAVAPKSTPPSECRATAPKSDDPFVGYVQQHYGSNCQ